MVGHYLVKKFGGPISWRLLSLTVSTLIREESFQNLGLKELRVISYSKPYPETVQGSNLLILWKSSGLTLVSQALISEYECN